MEENNYNEMQYETGADAQATQQQPDQKDGAGAKIGAAIIVILIVLGGVYFVRQYTLSADERAERIDTQEAAELDTTMEENAAIVEQLSTVSTSTDLSDIEADLNATDLGDIDAEIDKIGL